MNNICSRCNKNFKYNSLLKRHLERKKQCIPLTINTNVNINNNNIDSNIDSNINYDNKQNNIINSTDNLDLKLTNSLKYILNDSKISKNDVIELLFKVINNNNNNIQIKDNDNNKDNNKNNNKDNNKDNNKNNNKDNNKDKDIINNNIITKKYLCKFCNKEYSDRYCLYKHNKLKRCKGIINKPIIEPINNNPILINHEPIINTGTTFNDLLGITITESDNAIINSNNITNNTNNYNTTNNFITINAFGCENIKHITIEEFKNLFNTINFTKILENLAELIYIKNVNNMNFTKQNTNKQIVTYLNNNMTIKRMSEKEFFKEFEENINKLCIELFYIYKDDLKYDDLIEYVKSFLMLNQLLFDKTNYKILQNDLANVTDSLFRNKKIIDIINDIELNIETNDELKENYRRNNISRINQKSIATNNFYLKKNKKNKEKNKDNKINLNDVKNIALENIKIDKQKQDNKYNNKDNRDIEYNENYNKLNIDKYNNKIINDRQKADDVELLPIESNTNIKQKKKKVIVINDDE